MQERTGRDGRLPTRHGAPNQLHGGAGRQVRHRPLLGRRARVECAWPRQGQSEVPRRPGKEGLPEKVTARLSRCLKSLS